MRALMFQMIAVSLVSGSLLIADDESSPDATLKGEWGTLTCKPVFQTIYLSEDRGIMQFPRGSLDTRKPVPICDVLLADANGKKVVPIDEGPSFLINGKAEKVVLKSSNPRAITVSNGTECVFGETGKSIITVRFAKETAKFPVNVVRTKIALGMKPTQVVKLYGKPSLRFRKTVDGSRLAGVSIIEIPEKQTVEVWRWERYPELSVSFNLNLGGGVESVGTSDFPSESEIEREVNGTLIEDSRMSEIKGKKKAD